MSGNERGTVRYTVPQAARLLGISERAVRKRIEAGTLAAERDGKSWVVLLPAVEEPQAERGTDAVNDGNPAVMSGTDTALLQHVHAENERLWAMLESERQAAHELRIIIANLTDTLRALPAPQNTHNAESPSVAENAPETSDSAPWWQFWRRE